MMALDNQTCALCSAPASLMCQRCLESYCSINCQITDWAKHKLICIPMPQLILKSNNSKLVTSNKFVRKNTQPIEFSYPTISNNIDKNDSSVNVANAIRRTEILRRPKLTGIKMNDSSVPNVNESFDNCNDISDILKRIDDMNTDTNSPFTTKFTNEVEEEEVEPTRPRTANKSEILTGGINENETRIKGRYGIRNFFQKKPQHNQSSATVNDRFKLGKITKTIYNSENENSSEMTFVTVNQAMKPKSAVLCEMNNQNSNSVTESIADLCKKPISISSRSPWKIPFPLSADKSIFTEAAVQYVDSAAKLIWVMSLALEAPATKLLNEINLNISDEKLKPEDIFVDHLVAAPFEDIYYRAIILEKTNQKNEIYVRLVDYGNDFFINIDQVKLPIPIMNNLNAYSFCCRYNKPINIGKVLNIRIIGKESNEIFIIEEKSNSISSKFEFENIVENLPDTFQIQICQMYGNNLNALGIIIDEIVENKLKKLNELLISEETFHYDFTEPPKIGDFVAARGNIWNRGVIIDEFNGKYLIFFIDIGRIEIVDQIKMIPKMFYEIPTQSLLINFNTKITGKDLTKLESYNLNTFTIKKSSNKVVTPELTLNGNLFDGDKKFAADISYQNLTGNLINVKTLNKWNVLLKNNDIVRITKVFDESNVTVSLDNVAEIYEKLFNEIGNTELLDFESEPEISKMVLVLNTEQMYVRCRIIDILENQTYHVQNVDTGVDFRTAQIRKVNNFIKYCPIYTVNVQLQIINELKSKILPLNQAISALEKYCSEQTKFILEYQNDFSNVHLHFHNDTKISMNKHLLPLLFETVDDDGDNNLKNIQNGGSNDKKAAAAELTKKLKFLDSSAITYKELTLGENIKLLILDGSVLKHGIVSAAVFDLDFLNTYYTEYQTKMNTHCANDVDTYYMPQINELCLTLFDVDDQWYRSICLEKLNNNMYLMMFLDFGNTQKVPKTCIRKFHEDFMFECISHTCIIDGMPKDVSTKDLDKISQYVKANAAIVIDKVERKNDNYILHIEAVKDLFK